MQGRNIFCRVINLTCSVSLWMYVFANAAPQKVKKREREIWNMNKYKTLCTIGFIFFMITDWLLWLFESLFNFLLISCMNAHFYYEQVERERHTQYCYYFSAHIISK